MLIEETEGTIIDSETMKIVKIGKLAKIYEIFGMYHKRRYIALYKNSGYSKSIY